MNKSYSQDIISAVRSIYKKNDHAQRLFDNLAERQRNPSNTTVERIAAIIEGNRWEAISLAKEIAETGCAQFAKGRAPNKTRLVWKYGCVGLAKIAMGQNVELTPPPATDTELDLEEDEEYIQSNDPSPSPIESVIRLTIPEAKEALARTLGILPEQIEILIKA